MNINKCKPGMVIKLRNVVAKGKHYYLVKITRVDATHIWGEYAVTHDDGTLTENLGNGAFRIDEIVDVRKAKNFV